MNPFESQVSQTIFCQCLNFHPSSPHRASAHILSCETFVQLFITVCVAQMQSVQSNAEHHLSAQNWWSACRSVLCLSHWNGQARQTGRELTLEIRSVGRLVSSLCWYQESSSTWLVEQYTELLALQVMDAVAPGWTAWLSELQTHWNLRRQSRK